MPTIDYFKFATDIQDFTAGSTIFEQGELGNTMFVVKEGEVDIFFEDKLLDTVTEHGFVGEMALIDSPTRSASAVARTDCKVVPVDKDRFLFMVQETPTFALQVMHVLAERLRKMNEMI